jgi:hypothetical protein
LSDPGVASVAKVQVADRTLHQDITHAAADETQLIYPLCRTLLKSARAPDVGQKRQEISLHLISP